MKNRTAVERSIACLKGLATGDAIGKQTETLKRHAVRQWYPDGITGFSGELGSIIPRYAAKRYKWLMGETTDDTEQSIAIAQTLLNERVVSHSSVGRALMLCRKSNHPDVSLGRFQQRGDPDFVCSDGDGCGAAMRVAPIGIVFGHSRLTHLIDAVYQAAVPTHGGQFGICAAASFAAAVSAAVDGKRVDEVFSIAIEAAKAAERFRPPGPVGNMATNLQRIYVELGGARHALSSRLQEDDCFPDRPAVIVPLAISLALVTKSARQTILLATNIGGDSDSVASIGGALAAAMNPESVDEEWFQGVEALNKHGLVGLAMKLAVLRQAGEANRSAGGTDDQAHA